MGVWDWIDDARADYGGWRDRLGDDFAGGYGGASTSQLPSLDQLAVRVSLAHRAIGIVPESALAKGWSTDTATESDTTSAIDSVAIDDDEGLGIEAALLMAARSARQGFGAWIWPVVDVPGDEWEHPRPPGRQVVSAVHVLTSVEVTPHDGEKNPASKRWTRPTIVSVQAIRGGISYNATRMHASWLIYVSGAPSPPSSIAGRPAYYDVSTLALYREALCAYDEGAGSIATLMKRLAFLWIQMPEGKALATGELAPEVKSRLRLLRKTMRTGSMMVLLGADKAGWSGPSIGGVAGAQTALAERVASVEGIALTILIGQSSPGLGNDNEGARKVFAELIERYRRHILKPVLLALYAMILGPDKTRRIAWPPSDVPTAVEAATASDILAGRDVKLHSIGAIDSTESRNRLTGETESPTPVFDEEAEDEDEGLDENADPTDGADIGEPEAEAAATLNELSLSIERLVRAGDFGMVNIVRAQMSEVLGAQYPGDLPPPGAPEPARADKADERDRARGPGTKHGARETLNKAIARGDITRPEKCPKCRSDVQIEGHHADYNKPLEVKWLCSQCHSDLHARSDASSKAFVSVPLSPAALEQWTALRARVEELLGELEDPGGRGPHVTLIFMGELEDEQLPEVVAGVGEVAGDAEAFSYRARRVASFEPTPNSGGKTPIIVQLEGWGFTELNDALLRRLAKPTNADQFKRFEAHVTIGLLDRSLTADERGALLEMKVELEGAAASVELAFGDSTVAAFPLVAVRTDTDEDTEP